MAGQTQKSAKPRVFRISEIPALWTSGDLEAVLETNGIKALSDTRLCPSALTPATCTAILTLDTSAPLLQKLNKDPMSDVFLPFDKGYLIVDQHFYGLTVVYTPPTEIKAE
jgi:hypothetical protein